MGDIAAELHEINQNLVKLNDSLQNSTSTIYLGIISAAKIESAQTDFERNTAMKEADDFLKEINQIGGTND